MESDELRALTWMGSSLKDLRSFPKPVQKEIGFTLHRIQEGYAPSNVKPLKGLGSGVMEIISDHNKNTYRAVYAVKLEMIYMSYMFFKKNQKPGFKHPKNILI